MFLFLLGIYIFVIIGCSIFIVPWCTLVLYIPIYLLDVACIVGNPTVVTRASEKRNGFHYSWPRSRACWTWLTLIKRSYYKWSGDHFMVMSFYSLITVLWYDLVSNKPWLANFCCRKQLCRDFPWWVWNRIISLEETTAVAKTPRSEDTFSRRSCFSTMCVGSVVEAWLSYTFLMFVFDLI